MEGGRKPKATFTESEYLLLERQAEYKSEYYQGEIFAMSGARRAHVVICQNLALALGNALRGRACQAFGSDMRVSIPSSRFYTYPDFSVVCGQEVYQDSEMDTLLNPHLIVEVLSPTTKKYDSGKKFELYKTISSLKQYLLIDSQKKQVMCFSRLDATGWSPLAEEPVGQISLVSIAVTIAIDELYLGITF